MGKEIERKFLLKNDTWRNDVTKKVAFRQGYLSGSDKASIRVRIEGDKANLNIKGATLGVVRQEFEYPVPLDDALELLDTLCDPSQVEKTRHYVEFEGYHWEIDEFHGANAGLVVAEIELSSEHEVFPRPAWLAEEVSDQPKYYNVMLIKHPYSSW